MSAIFAILGVFTQSLNVWLKVVSFWVGCVQALLGGVRTFFAFWYRIFLAIYDVFSNLYTKLSNDAPKLARLVKKFRWPFERLYGGLIAPAKRRAIQKYQSTRQGVAKSYNGLLMRWPWLRYWQPYRATVIVAGYVMVFVGGMSEGAVKFLRYFITWVLLILLWMVFGYAFLLLEDAPQNFSSTANVIVTGLISLTNVILATWNGFAMSLNILQPLFNVPMRILFGIIEVVLGGFDDLISGPGDNRRGLATSPIYNPFLSDTQGLEDVSEGFLKAEAPLITALTFLGDLVIVAIEIVRLVFGIFAAFGDVLKSITSVGCCGSSGDAVGCCIADIFVSFVFSFSRLVGLDQFISEKSLSDALSCKKVSGASCLCSEVEGGIFRQMPACQSPTYECRTVREGNKETYEEWITTYTGPIENNGQVRGVSSIKRVGTTKAAACPNYSRSQGRRALQYVTEGEEKCSKYCIRDQDTAYLFMKCESGLMYFDGHCDKPLSGEQRKTHLERYFNSYKIEKTERRQLLAHEANGAWKEQPKAKPRPDDAPPPVVTLEKFKLYIRYLEGYTSRVAQCTEKVNDDDDFTYLAYRLFCLGMKALEDNSQFILEKLKESQHQSANQPLLARHLAVVVKHASQNGTTLKDFHREFVDVHKRVFKEKTGGDSMVVEYEGFFNQTLPYMRQNLRGLVLKSKEAYMERKYKTRKLQEDTNVFTSQGGLCGYDSYECPDTKCVGLADKLSCKVPAAWNPAVMVRYFFFLITTFFESLDSSVYLLYSTIACWEGYSKNPATDPTTLTSYIARWTGDKAKLQLLEYCFPLYESIPFSPYITWDFNKFLKASCQSSFLLPGDATVQNCVCPQYAIKGVFNYAEYWQVWTPEFYRVRLTKAAIVFRYLLTRIPLLNFFLDNFWYTATSPFTTEPDVLYAFNQTYQDFGQTTGQNIFCIVMNFGSTSWTIVFILFPFYSLMVIFFGPIRRLLNAVFCTPFRKGEEDRRTKKKIKMKSITIGTTAKDLQS